MLTKMVPTVIVNTTPIVGPQPLPDTWPSISLIDSQSTEDDFAGGGDGVLPGYPVAMAYRSANE